MREILRMVISDTVINTLFGGLTLDPAGMHCPSWDDAFVSSVDLFSFGVLTDTVGWVTVGICPLKNPHRQWYVFGRSVGTRAHLE